MNGSEQWDGPDSSYNCHFKQNIQGELGRQDRFSFFSYDSQTNQESGYIWIWAIQILLSIDLLLGLKAFVWNVEYFAVLGKNIKTH